MELRPGLKDVRRPAELMDAYIMLSLLTGIRTEEATALHWPPIGLGGDPNAQPAPAVPCGRTALGMPAQRNQD
jgi:hypothetical protein